MAQLCLFFFFSLNPQIMYMLQHAVSVKQSMCCAFSAQRKKSSVASLDPEGINVEVGDQVLVAGQKNGVVRYYGKTDFAPGQSTVPSAVSLQSALIDNNLLQLHRLVRLMF